MRSRAIVFCMAVFVPLIIFLVALFVSLSQLDQPPLGAQAGRRVWQDRGCTECHTIFGDGGYTAKEITGIYSQRGQAWLTDFFSQPPMLTEHFRHPSVTGDQQGWLLEFLSYIDTLNIGGWPPRPIPPQQLTEERQP